MQEWRMFRPSARHHSEGASAMGDQAAIETSAGYTATARVLHWVTAILVLAQIVLGILIANKWTGAWQDQLYDLHKSNGAVLIPIILIRIFYRWGHPPPPLPADIPPIQQFAAHTTHYLLYGLVVVQVFLGWIATAAYPAPVPIYGLFNVPSIWPENRALSEQLLAVHKVVGISIAIVAAMHIGAALFHHFVRKDRVLMRMISG
jgi:cytochrome b561